MMYLYGIYSAFPFSGRVRYKFASFWNRNHALRALQRSAKNYEAMLEAEKKVHFVFCANFNLSIDTLLIEFPFIGLVMLIDCKKRNPDLEF